MKNISNSRLKNKNDAFTLWDWTEHIEVPLNLIFDISTSSAIFNAISMYEEKLLKWIIGSIKLSRRFDNGR